MKVTRTSRSSNSTHSAHSRLLCFYLRWLCDPEKHHGLVVDHHVASQPVGLARSVEVRSGSIPTREHETHASLRLRPVQRRAEELHRAASRLARGKDRISRHTAKMEGQERGEAHGIKSVRR